MLNKTPQSASALPDLVEAAQLAADIFARQGWLEQGDAPEAVALRKLRAAILKASERPSLDTNRAAFESACLQHVKEAGFDESALKLNRDGERYIDKLIQAAWWGWQAARAHKQ